jgi:hypothetical protein
VAPSGNQAATEKTNLNLYHSENPVYSPKVGPSECGMQIAECGIGKDNDHEILRRFCNTSAHPEQALFEAAGRWGSEELERRMKARI